MALQMKHLFLEESRFLEINLRETMQACGWEVVPETRGRWVRAWQASASFSEAWGGSAAPSMPCAKYPEDSGCVGQHSTLRPEAGKPFLHLISAAGRVSGAAAPPKKLAPQRVRRLCPANCIMRKLVNILGNSWESVSHLLP